MPLSKVIKEAMLETVLAAGDPAQIQITSSEVNRPGLALAGYFDYFKSDRIQIIGMSESGFLEDLPEELRHTRLEELISRRPPAAARMTSAPARRSRSAQSSASHSSVPSAR